MTRARSMPKLDRAPQQMVGPVTHAIGEESTHVAVPLAGFSGDVTVFVRPWVASGFQLSPPRTTLMFLWDEQFGVRITDAGATSSRLSFVRDLPTIVLPNAASALD